MANSRTVEIHNEAVGEPRDNFQDTLVADVTYYKGRGYSLSARIQVTEQCEGYSVYKFLLYGGINYSQTIETAKRFSAKKLRELGEDVKATSEFADTLDTLKDELTRRIAAGESY